MHKSAWEYMSAMLLLQHRNYFKTWLNWAVSLIYFIPLPLSLLKKIFFFLESTTFSSTNTRHKTKDKEVGTFGTQRVKESSLWWDHIRHLWHYFSSIMVGGQCAPTCCTDYWTNTSTVPLTFSDFHGRDSFFFSSWKSSNSFWSHEWLNRVNADSHSANKRHRKEANGVNRLFTCG